MVVAASAGEEVALVGRQVAGALACGDEVDILIAGGVPEGKTQDGVICVRQFSSRPVATKRRGVVAATLFGVRPGSYEDGCECHRSLMDRYAEDAPEVLQFEALRHDGTDSPGLLEHLRSGSYQRVVFVGCCTASTLFGVEAVPADVPVIVVPVAREEPQLRFRILDSVFRRAGRVLVLSEWERHLIESRFGHQDIRNIGMVLRVNRLAARTEPPGLEDRPYIVVAGGAVGPGAMRRLLAAISLFASELPEARLCIVGGDRTSTAMAASSPFAVEHGVTSRVDLWRWMSRALALVDPEPGRVLGREVLESMLLGTPVVVRDDAGAAREHVERGGGGLWYRSTEELVACLRALSNPEVRNPLAAQGQRYVEERFGDRDAFVDRVRAAVGI